METKDDKAPSSIHPFPPCFHPPPLPSTSHPSPPHKHIMDSALEKKEELKQMEYADALSIHEKASLDSREDIEDSVGLLFYTHPVDVPNKIYHRN